MHTVYAALISAAAGEDLSALFIDTYHFPLNLSLFDKAYSTFSSVVGCTDSDGDGYGCIGDQACAGGSAADCDDGNAAVHPAAKEVCDSLDNDCDGSIDESLGQTTCGVGACSRTIENCVGGVPKECVPGTPATEICNGSPYNNNNGRPYYHYNFCSCIESRSILHSFVCWWGK
jgi:hypothetical protein